MFQTKRLILRAVEESDYDRMMQLWNDRDVQKSITHDWVVPRGPKFKETVKQRVEGALLYVTVMTRPTPGRYVGQAAIMLQGGVTKNRDAGIGLSLAKEHWGKGYGTEIMKCLIEYAFMEMGFHRMSLSVFSSNTRAVELYKRLGFVEEGRTRESVWQDGGWIDVIQMGLLDREWRALQDQVTSSTPQ